MRRPGKKPKKARRRKRRKKTAEEEFLEEDVPADRIQRVWEEGGAS